MIKIIVAEDEPLFANTIEMLIDKLGYELIKIVANSDDFIEIFEQSDADIALLDIKLEGKLDGIGVAEHIRLSAKPIPVIFITSLNNQEVFERAKQTNPYAYIIKPFAEADLERAIELAIYKHSEAKNQTKWPEDEEFNGWRNDILLRQHVFIKVENKLEKVHVQDIAYIIVEDKYLQVFTIQKKYLVRMTLKEMLDKLPSDEFVQVHRNYIINALHISDIDLKNDSVTVLNQKINVSKRLKDYFLNRLNKLY